MRQVVGPVTLFTSREMTKLSLGCASLTLVGGRVAGGAWKGGPIEWFMGDWLIGDAGVSIQGTT
jgi:hypothetical protein